MNSIDLNQLPQDPFDAADNEALQQLSFAFGQSAQETMNSLADLPAELAQPVKELVWKHEQQTRLLSRSARATLGDPQQVMTADPQTRQIFKGTVYPQAGTPENTAARHNTLAEIAQAIKYAEVGDQIEAAMMADAVFLASAETPMPAGTSEGHIAELKRDIEQLISAEGEDKDLRQFVAAKLLREAALRGDDALVSTLMGDRMRLSRERFGLDTTSLARVLFRARMDAVQGRFDRETKNMREGAAALPGSTQHAQVGVPKYAAFLSRQLDQETNLGKVARNAAGVLRHAHEFTRKRAPR